MWVTGGLCMWSGRSDLGGRCFSMREKRRSGARAMFKAGIGLLEQMSFLSTSRKGAQLDRLGLLTLLELHGPLLSAQLSSFDSFIRPIPDT